MRVVEVDLARKRIALTMKLDAKPAPKGERAMAVSGRRRAASVWRSGQRRAQAGSAMADAFAKLRSGR